MFPEKKYIIYEKPVGGFDPSELALFACNVLNYNSLYSGEIDILDLGCGDGRNAVYLASQLNCHILGIDKDEKAIAWARQSCPKELANRIEFLCYDFSLVVDKFDMIFVSNLYHWLQPDDRVKLLGTIKRCLKKGGWLFLNALSTRDPQHSSRVVESALSSGTGSITPASEPWSISLSSLRPLEALPDMRFQDSRLYGKDMKTNPSPDNSYCQFSTREELQSDFNFLDIHALFEREYHEDQDTGESRRQISWILYGLSRV